MCVCQSDTISLFFACCFCFTSVKGNLVKGLTVTANIIFSVIHKICFIFILCGTLRYFSIYHMVCLKLIFSYVLSVTQHSCLNGREVKNKMR